MKLMAIDGNSIINRAFYGIRMLNAPDGTPTNAVYGFLSTFRRVFDLAQPQAVCVAFDVHTPTFRHEQYALYKAQRKPMPEELREQVPLIKEMLSAMGINIMSLEGYEADDLLGTVARRSEAKGMDVTILSGDRDLLQLATDKVLIRLPKTVRGKTTVENYHTAEVLEKYQVTPPQIIELKALMGDSSDNIPGVPGVGEKTALGLIQKYHTVDYIYQNLDTIEVTKGVRAKLENGRESAELSRKLAEITLEAPVELDMSAYEKKDGDPAEAAGILTEMEMFGVMKKLGLDKTAPAKVALASIASEGTAPAPDNAGTPAVEAAEKADIPEFDPAAYDVAFSGGEVRVFLAGKPQEGAAAILASEAPKRTDDAKALYSYCMKNGMELIGCSAPEKM